MLSITAVGMHNTVLSLPADLPPSAVPRVCNLKTATRSPPPGGARGDRFCRSCARVTSSGA
eukprot:6155298-Prymnesium_polylepis.1